MFPLTNGLVSLLYRNEKHLFVGCRHIILWLTQRLRNAELQTKHGLLGRSKVESV